MKTLGRCGSVTAAAAAAVDIAVAVAVVAAVGCKRQRHQIYEDAFWVALRNV